MEPTKDSDVTLRIGVPTNLERRLTQQMRQGSVVALGQLFELHRARLERIILLRLDSRIARRLSEQDVLQEVYLRASNRLKHFASRTTLSAFMWFRLLAYQQLTELYRRHLG